MPRASLLPAAALATLLAVGRPAAADDTTQAQALFVEGRAALERGDFVAACTKFNQSLSLVKRASTLLNLGQCEAETGQLARSVRHWREGIALLPHGDERLSVAAQRVAAVEARLPHLQVAFSGPTPPEARFEVDGALVPAADLVAGLPVDPGRHTILLRLPGSADQRSTVVLVEKESRTLTFSPGAPAAAVAVAPTPLPEPPPPPPPPSGTTGVRKAGFALLGVGLAGGVVAGVTGGLLVSRHASIDAACPVQNGVHACTPEGRSLIDGVRPLNIANAVGWGVGIAGVASGVVLIVLGKAPAAVAPTALPGGGGVWMTGRF